MWVRLGNWLWKYWSGCRCCPGNVWRCWSSGLCVGRCSGLDMGWSGGLDMSGCRGLNLLAGQLGTVVIALWS